MHALKEEMKNLDRLKKRSDFLRLTEKGAKWVSKSFILLAAPNEGLGVRFGVTATKKLDKRAVGRNRIKRRLRAVACDILPLGSLDNMDYVLIGRAETPDRPYIDLQKDLTWCLKKMGFLKTAGLSAPNTGLVE